MLPVHCIFTVYTSVLYNFDNNSCKKRWSRGRYSTCPHFPPQIDVYKQPNNFHVEANPFKEDMIQHLYTTDTSVKKRVFELSRAYP